MGSVSLHELCVGASALVRRVEGGEVIDITVAGRLAARMIPAQPKQWLDGSAVALCFVGRADPDWQHDRDLIDNAVVNQWVERPGLGV